MDVRCYQCMSCLPSGHIQELISGVQPLTTQSRTFLRELENHSSHSLVLVVFRLVYLIAEVSLSWVVDIWLCWWLTQEITRVN